jgi:hypothetical protein
MKWTESQVKEVTEKFFSEYKKFHGNPPSFEEIQKYLEVRLKYPPNSKSFWLGVMFEMKAQKAVGLLLSLRKASKQFNQILTLDAFLNKLGTFECTEEAIKDGATWTHLLNQDG